MNPTSPSTLEFVHSWIADSKLESKTFELTEERVAFILDGVKDKPYAVTFHLMVRSGLRLGEALAVKWEDVNLGERCVYVQRQVQEVAKKVLAGTKKESNASQHIIDPKSKAGIRTVPLQGDTLELLRFMPMAEQPDYIYSTANGTPVHSSTFRGRVFKPLMEEIGLKNVTPHDLRRYCGTELLALATKYGTDLEQVRQIMGHKDLSTTLNIYAQARPDYQERFLTLLANRNVA